MTRIVTTPPRRLKAASPHVRQLRCLRLGLARLLLRLARRLLEPRPGEPWDGKRSRLLDEEQDLEERS